MIRLYHAPRTRSVRVRWLLEELGVPYELKRVDFQVPTRMFVQATPNGKIPVVEDGDVVVFESGAIVEYLLERYGQGRLAPSVGSPLRAQFLQWMHYAEGTAAPPLSVILWHTFYRGDAGEFPGFMEAWRERAHDGLLLLERALDGKDHLLGEFSAADVMVGFTMGAARVLGVLDDRLPNLTAYLARLEARPAYQRASAD
jgi:glutathione S-transferase